MEGKNELERNEKSFLVYKSHVSLHSKGAIFISYCQQFLYRIKGECCWVVRKAVAECLWKCKE